MVRRLFLLDVSRLLNRTLQNRLPTGIDRVLIAYIRQYADCSLAFVRCGSFFAVLSEKDSQVIFRLLLSPKPGLKTEVVRLIASGVAVGVRKRDLKGAVLLNIGHSGLEQYSYHHLLRSLQVRPVCMVHDLIPLTHPEYCRPGEQEKHLIRMQAVLTLAYGVITNSQTTLNLLNAFAFDQSLKMPEAVSGFLAPPQFENPSLNRPVERPYFIVLSTIEPRKNHLMLLQIWKRLVEQQGEQAPLLVLVGQRGWECENVVDLLERCSLLHGHVLELTRCSDQELVTWLHHAQALLFPSFTEGFGLPLVEALACGVPVIASNLDVFKEIAGDLPEYCDPLDALGWLSLVRRYSTSNDSMRAEKINKIKQYHAPTWTKHFDIVNALLEKVTC